MKQNWEYKPVGDISFITDFVSNGSFASLRENVKYLDVKDYAVLVRYADYTNGFDEKKFVYVNRQSYEFLSKSKLQAGDIIMSNVGSLGKLFICPDLGQPMSIAPNSILIRTDNNKYYYYFFQSRCFQSEIKRISSTTALPKFNKTQFKKIPIPVPPLSTQTAIVSELDALSAIIADHKSLLKKYDELEQSIFYYMFGDPVKNDKGWEVDLIGNIWHVSSSKRIYKDDISNEDGIPFLKVADVVDLINGKCTPSCFISKSHYEKLREENNVPHYNDILITSRGTLGKVYIMKEEDEFYFQDGMITWLSAIKKDFNPLFFKFLFENKNYSTKLGIVANQSTVAYISISQIKELSIPLPPLPLQQQFASKIESIEQMRADTKKSLAKSEELFNARMDYYFNA